MKKMLLTLGMLASTSLFAQGIVFYGYGYSGEKEFLGGKEINSYINDNNGGGWDTNRWDNDNNWDNNNGSLHFERITVRDKYGNDNCSGYDSADIVTNRVTAELSRDGYERLRPVTLSNVRVYFCDGGSQTELSPVTLDENRERASFNLNYGFRKIRELEFEYRVGFTNNPPVYVPPPAPNYPPVVVNPPVHPPVVVYPPMPAPGHGGGVYVPPPAPHYPPAHPPVVVAPPYNPGHGGGHGPVVAPPYNPGHGGNGPGHGNNKPGHGGPGGHH